MKASGEYQFLGGEHRFLQFQELLATMSVVSLFLESLVHRIKVMRTGEKIEERQEAIIY